ncbi:hypothetical protein PR202_ga19656 [Eleusine coracana subsp. coracana]|uniref:Uncharacterized protein n=1 Tax=Eleusine coracana subsp. coracana TaxID=191504 RepID=A0AAV5CWN2_ELECO|nr:hypothetical protein PR202_ga19656 [Eleusine coracana subsp. coracana]
MVGVCTSWCSAASITAVSQEEKTELAACRSRRCAAQGTALRPLHGGALTLGWTRAPTRGCVAAPPPPLSTAAVVDSLSSAGLKRGEKRRGGGQRKEREGWGSALALVPAMLFLTIAGEPPATWETTPPPPLRRDRSREWLEMALGFRGNGSGRRPCFPNLHAELSDLLQWTRLSGARQAALGREAVRSHVEPVLGHRLQAQASESE